MLSVTAPLLVQSTADRLSLQAAAARGPLAYSTLRKRIAKGDLPAHRIGRRVFVRPSDVDKLAEAVAVGPTAAAAVDSAISRLVKAAPRLTDEQRARLAVVIGGGPA